MCEQSTLMLPCYLSTQQQQLLKGARSSPAASMQQCDASHIPQEPRQLQPRYMTYTGLQAWAGEVFSKSRPTFLPSWAAVKTAQKNELKKHSATGKHPYQSVAAGVRQPLRVTISLPLCWAQLWSGFEFGGVRDNGGVGVQNSHFHKNIV